MATRRYSIPPAGNLQQVTEAVGAPVVSQAVELTVDIGTNVMNDVGGTRKVSRSEVLQAIDQLKAYIEMSNWPPV